MLLNMQIKSNEHTANQPKLAKNYHQQFTKKGDEYGISPSCSEVEPMEKALEIWAEEAIPMQVWDTDQEFPSSETSLEPFLQFQLQAYNILFDRLIYIYICIYTYAWIF